MNAPATVSSSPIGRPFLDFNHVPDVVLPQYNKDDIRARLLEQLESVLMSLFPHGKRRGPRFVVGNVQGEPGDSLAVELEGQKRGLWIDFATGESGDVLTLWASARGFVLPGDFSQMLEDIGTWLAMPRIACGPLTHASTAFDDLGPHAGKWDYLDVDGRLLACVYRYNTPGGKQYRPWDARARSMRMPDPRPLYNLPALVASDAVVLVEGEKCADALARIGIVATTAMGGAATTIDKTDWSPLAGKTVAVWPDHDTAGAKYADAVIPKLQQIGARVRRVTVPEDKPKKWDVADAVEEGFDVESLLVASTVVADAMAARSLDITRWHAAERFTGEPQARRWLVDGVFPQAQAALVAAAGGVGKSFLLLALAREVAAFNGIGAKAPTLFGGTLAAHGAAVYVTAEDDAIEVHNRLNALGPIPDGLYVLPLPDAGGAVPLFAPDPATRGPATTPAWTELERQLKAMPGLCLVVLDPLQPLCALDLNVPENAQFVCSRLAALAASTGASVIVSHHFAKREASTPEQAREAIRGTGGLVDGVRSVYALWSPKEEQARTLCQALGEPFERARVVMGGVVKANGRANLNVTTFLRDSRGLLIDRSKDVTCAGKTDVDLLPALRDAIARAAIEGKPYTKTGGNGVYERRHELPQAFHAIGKHRLADWVGTLLDKQELVMSMAEGSKLVKWLDVPGGPVARGEAVFVAGHVGGAGR
ncbi:AAA family ATPase [Ralstonia solanacearum]|uniref:AAA family ATPase n=1 Tax=Ralstonia solanacearum TaxID=305 RepID=UPI0001D93E13|nr:AAA family ATPase [Ralstonia solanacearum]MDB0529430.1 AAA family ATPase [Ralstonia solanacearum]CBJ41552.1 putative TOPRIM domain protein [Ralstonia solanacearum CFBP2957]